MYEAVAAVRCELPALLRLPPAMYFAWEPGEGVGVVHLNPGVGQLEWSRRCRKLGPQELLGLAPEPEAARAVPAHGYMFRAGLSGGESLYLGELLGGKDGGFREPRPYTVATVFLCLRERAAAGSDEILGRSADALNNVIGLHRFVTMDPLSRPVRAPLDAVYAIESLADVPGPLRDRGAREVLEAIPVLLFESSIGRGRTNYVGLNTREDLLPPLSLQGSAVSWFAHTIQRPHELDLHHELFLSAIRRLRRADHALAIVDAQSAFESFVAAALRDGLLAEEQADVDIDRRYAFPGDLHSLSQRLSEMDAIAQAAAPSSRPFRGSAEREAWKRDLSGPRNNIAHAGLRTVDFDGAKRGVASGLKAVAFLERLHPAFQRRLTWQDALLDLDHVMKTPGSLFRLFQY